MASDGPVITCIEFTRFNIQLENLSSDASGMGIAYRPGAGDPMERFAVRVHTDEGIVGEYVPNRARAPVIVPASIALAYGLIGQPALAREHHYQRMRRATKHVGEAGIGALDIALWDLAGKYLGVPVYQMLGGFRKVLPAYASTLAGDRQPDGLSSPEAYADFARQCVDMGYPGYKLHGWHEGDPQAEISLLWAVRDEVGYEVDLMYDAACNLKTFADAVRVGRVCDELDFMWYEDPFADGGVSINAHLRLKRLIRTPLLISEHVRNAEATVDMMVAGATDFARVDPDYDGGITGAMKVAQAAETLGMDYEVHSCGPAMRHVMAAMQNSNYYEINLLHPRLKNAWHLPVYACDYSDDLDCIDAYGNVPVPDGKGLGVNYDWEQIEYSKFDTVTIGRRA